MRPPLPHARLKLSAITASTSTVIAIAVLPALLAACGGSSSGTPAGPVVSNAPTVNVQGTVVGKYAGAMVCSDVNDNGVCDADESTTMTDSSGNFTLAATSANLPTVAMIAPNTAFVDPVTGAASKTTSAVVFRAPAAANTILSSVSTEVVREMEAGSLDEPTAVANFAGRIGVDPTQVLVDFTTLTDATAKQAVVTEANIDAGRFTLASTMVARGDISPATGAVTTVKQAEQDVFNLEGVPRFDNLFVIILENHTNTNIDGSPFTPKITGWLHQGNRATNYFSTGQPSEPNYIALGSGDDWGIVNDDPWFCNTLGDTRDTPTDAIPAGAGSCPSGGESAAHNLKNVRSMFTTLKQAGMTWRVYNESMNPGQDVRIDGKGDATMTAPDNLNPTVTLPFPGGLYKTKHNNSMGFDDVRNDGQFFQENRTMGGSQWDAALQANPTRPATWNIDQLGTDLASGDVGNLNYLIPDQCDDMHGISVPSTVAGTSAGDCTSGSSAIATRGDNYTDKLIRKIQASPLWANRNKRVGIVITFDEGNGMFVGPASCCGWNASGKATNGQIGEAQTVTEPIAGYGGGNQGNGPIIFGVLTNQPNAPQGVTDADQYSHFAFVRTMQDMFGVADPGVATSYMNRSKYTQSFIAANLLSLPEYQGSIDPHFDAVRPMAKVFALK
ncbi:MAG: alkaline phosphatase family protein [Pararobbsia sp.]